MPKKNGLEILKETTKSKKRTKIVFLTMYKDTLMARKALQAGASGYILKDNAFADLLYGISTVSSGGTFISPSVSRSFVKASDTEDKESQFLTLRESEILKLIASGLTNKQIADKLFISIKTVETHRKNIMQKLDVHTIADLVKYTIKTGLLDL